MQEEWRDIVIEKNGIVYDYSGLYQVSNLGRVKTLGKGKTQKQEKILKTQINKNGYVSISLNKDGKRQAFYVHRLVATMFIPNPNNLPEVNHKSEIKTENHIENLEWCDKKYNMIYGTRIERQSNSQKGKFVGKNNPRYGVLRTEEEKRKQSESMKGKYVGSKNPKAKKVLCVETGQIFGCVKEAKAWLGKGNVLACAKGRTKTAGGYHWQYVD